MALVRSPQKQWPRGPVNDLHRAAIKGSTARVVALIASGTIEIDRGTENGMTPLMLAACGGYSPIVRILLNKGASISIANDHGITAMHFSARAGHLAVTKLLVKAGANLEARDNQGYTPLHVAAGETGRSEVVRLLIDSGANPNSRLRDGGTPLCVAARDGCFEAMKVLLRANADPLLTRDTSGDAHVPLDIAARGGHLDMVRELIRQFGVEGCGGDSGGVRALGSAAGKEQVEVMTFLTDIGVVDTGEALRCAAQYGRTEAIKFLLQQREKKGKVVSYVNHKDPCGRTALVFAVLEAGFASARVARLLVDAGADTASPVLLSRDSQGTMFGCTKGTPVAITPVALAEFYIDAIHDATEEQLNGLQATRRFLLRVEAVRAVSWLWHTDSPPAVLAAAEGARRSTKTSSLKAMLPILRRRARRPNVFVNAVCR